MLVANNRNGDRCKAWLTEKPEMPFHCPECNEEVVLKKGRVKAHHFAHKPPITCRYGTGETQIHWNAKRSIFEALVDHPLCKKCDVERRLEGVRPDVSLYVREFPVAIEIQNSTIEIDEIDRRARCYLKLGIHLLWVIPDNMPANCVDTGDGEKIIHRPKDWQKYLHAMYFGKLYFWQERALVRPAHFESYKHYVEPGNWVEDFYDDIGDSLEGTYWHDEHYDDAEYGGHYKTSKTKKEVHYPKEDNKNIIHIAEDFAPSKRKSFTVKNWHIPDSLIWIDTLKKWW
jgi:competence protein CoiA